MKVLNIQGLTNSKYLELHQEINKMNIVCLTETQKKIENVRIGQEVTTISSMREMSEKKGGGLMILYKEEEEFYFEKVENGLSDCLDVRGRVGKQEVNISLVYLGTGGGEEVRSTNRGILGHIMRIVGKVEEREEKLIVTGDFNCHLGYLGYQKENENGAMVNKFIEESGLQLINLDDRCNGMYTWERGESRSVIDLVLMNEKAYKDYEMMNIDESREKIDLSDHNLIEVEMRVQQGRKMEGWTGWKSGYFYSTKKEKMEKYVRDVEEELMKLQDPSMSQINRTIILVAEKQLKTKYGRRTTKEGNEEPPWMCEEIRREIAVRRQKSKAYRKCQGEEDKSRTWREYRNQKEKVGQMISDKIRKYEEKIAEEIRNMKGGRDLWRMIDKLKGKKVDRRKDLKVYRENGEELKGDQCGLEIKKFWEKIYRKNGNNMEEEWSEVKRREYMEMIRRERLREEDPSELWLPRVGDPYRNVRVMKLEVREKDVVAVLGGLKSGRAGGVDGITPEMFRELRNSRPVVEIVRRAMEDILCGGREPDDWRQSRTVMLPKNRKPTVAELRPIALTTISYKLMMKLIKEKLERHIEENGMRRGEQAGFTQGGEILDNLVILRECVRQAYKRGEELVVVAVDFKKAYDSIKREKVLMVLKKYKVPEELVELTNVLYCGDKTVIEMGGGGVEIEVDSGIRQGCTASPLFFKLITYQIIDELRMVTQGVRMGGKKLNSLFFADDGLLLAGGVVEAGKMIRSLKSIGGKYGLEISVDKSKCMIYNKNEKPREIEGLEVVGELRYLGMLVEDRCGLYDKHRERMIEKAKKLSKMAYSVVEKSCHRVMIGKVYWKSVVLPSVLFGMEVVDWREEDIEKLQRQENVALRRMLGAPRYATVAGMRGEVGIGTMKSRIVRGRIQYLRRKMQGRNELVKGVMRQMIIRDEGWWKKTRAYLEWAGISVEQVANIGKGEIRGKVAARMEEEWRQEVLEKKTLWLYGKCKGAMSEEDYSGGEESRIWFAARTNCLWLGDRQRDREGDGCAACGGLVVEDLRHFLLECEGLEEERRAAVELQRPRVEDFEETMGEFLFGGEGGECGRRKKMGVLKRMWKRRKTRIGDREGDGA